MRLRFPVVLLLLLISVFARAQMIPTLSIDSVELQAAQAQRIVVGNITQIEKSPDGSSEMTLAVHETIKGKAESPYRFKIYSPKADLDRLKVKAATLLVIDSKRGVLGLKRDVYDLSDPGLTAFRADYSVIGDPKRLLRIFRELARKTSVPQQVDAFEIVYAGGRNRKAWLKAAQRVNPYRQPVRSLRVPIDAALEKRAHGWLLSRIPEERQVGIQALRTFRSPDNVRRVRRLLKDPYFKIWVRAEDGFGEDQGNYPVREAAYAMLVEWGEKVEKSVVQEARSHLATLTTLSPPISNQYNDFSYLDEAKRLQSFNLVAEAPLSDAQLAPILRRKDLRELRLRGGGIGPSRLATILETMPHLRALGLAGNPLTDADLERLAVARNLRRVELDGTEVTDEGLAQLRRDRPDLTVFPDRARPPIRQAIARDDLPALRRVLERFPDSVRTLDEERATPLHEATVLGRLEAARALLERGADPNAQDRSGATPLSRTTESYPPNLPMIRLLLERGADPNIANSQGGRPLDRVLYGDQWPIASLLLATGAENGTGWYGPFERIGNLETRNRALVLEDARRHPVWAVPATGAVCDRPFYTLTAPSLANWSTISEGVAAFPSWSRTPSGREYLGPFGQQSVALLLKNLPPHRNVKVEIELFVIGSWDGNGGIGTGPDLIDLSVPGLGSLLHATFFNNSEEGAERIPMQSFPDPYAFGFHPAYTGAAEVRTLGFLEEAGRPRDAVYRIARTFAHSAPNLSLAFRGRNGVEAGVDRVEGDERWGIARLVVTTD